MPLKDLPKSLFEPIDLALLPRGHLGTERLRVHRHEHAMSI